jgi:uncharacterized C2H2 Zn-finger protein
MSEVDRSEHRKAILHARLREEMSAGLAASLDPENAGLPPLYRHETTIYSPWYTRACPECKHKFREGDTVRLCPRCGRVYHDDDQYQLHCWEEHFAEDGVCRKARIDPITGVPQEGCDYTWSGQFPEEGREAAEGPATRPTRRVARVTKQFLRGLEAFWTPFGEENVLEVSPDSPIVGHECPWCRFQIRAGDRVVKCPCGQCNTYFHDDVFRHLTCWDEWNGSQGHDYCPTTGAKIERSPRSSDR